MSASILMMFLLPVSQSALEDIARAEQDRLNSCITLTETDPSAAYEDSLAWLSNGNRPKARYCNAISLLALQHYEEGALRLEALATAPDAISASERALYLTQAGNAWLTANYPEAAIVSFTDALKLQTGDMDLYKDRAAAYLSVERWMEGVDDLNIVLEHIPTDSEALGLRARAHLKTDNLAAAQADLDSALALSPRNIDFLVLRGEIREAIRLKNRP